MDIAVCAKVLQLVNSAYFGLGQKIVSIRPAVTYLGVEIIKSLVLGSSSFSDKAISEVKGFSPDRLQNHRHADRAARQEDRLEPVTRRRGLHRRPAARHRRAGAAARGAARLRAGARSATRSSTATPPRPNARSSASRTPRSAPIYLDCGASPSRSSRPWPSITGRTKWRPNRARWSRPCTSPAALVEEMTDPGRRRRPPATSTARRAST